MAQEKNYENKVKKKLHEHGAWYIKYWAGAEFTKSGVPDILACVYGRFVAVEVKAEHGKASELQKYNLRQIESAGGFAWLLYPKQWYVFCDFLNALCNSPLYAEKLYLENKGWTNE